MLAELTKIKAIKLTRAEEDTEIAYYLFPPAFLEETAFIEYLEQNTNSFVELTKLSERIRWPQACFPYFINEDCRVSLIEIGLGTEIEFVEVTLLSRKEYNERFARIFNEMCFTCAFSNNWHIGSIEHGADNISLTGECFRYQRLDPPRDMPQPTGLDLRYW